LRLEARFSCPAGSLVYPTGRGGWSALQFGDTVFVSSLDDRGLFGSFVSSLGSGKSPDSLTLSVELPGMTLPSGTGLLREQRVKGSFKARLADMGFVQGLVPEVTEPVGVLTADLDLKGTLGKPVLAGTVSLLDGSTKIPLLGLSLKSIRVVLTGDPQGGFTFRSVTESGQGRLTAEGSAGAIASEPRKITLDVKGENFTAARTPVISLTVSPDIRLSSENGIYYLTGTVRVPEATFRPKEVTSTNSLSPDVVIIDSGHEPPQEPTPQFQGDLTFILGDKVTFEGFGLKGRISGTVRILEEPGSLTSATGELNITEGHYRAYGQDLTIERGRLLFLGGPIENPGLDIRAIRRIEDVTAGVQVGGTFNAPEVSLFSEPRMDQADALSYLVLGKPMMQASGDEGQVLSSAALSMGLTQGEALAGRIGKAFGFEEVTVESGANMEESAVVVGRYLTPRVYVRYGVGLFQDFSLFQFGYRISDKLLLQGQSGDQSSTDLLYTIER